MFPDLTSIKIRRQRIGLKQNQLAELAGVSQSLIAKLEKNKIEPSYSLAVKIFQTLDGLEHKNEKKCKDIMNPKLFFVKKNDRVEKASSLMKKYSVDQLPILQGQQVIGSMSESLIFSKIMELGKNKVLKMPVEDIMAEPFPIVNSEMPLSIVLPILKTEPAILISEKRKIKGIITKANLI